MIINAAVLQLHCIDPSTRLLDRQNVTGFCANSVPRADEQHLARPETLTKFSLKFTVACSDHSAELSKVVSCMLNIVCHVPEDFEG